MRVVRATSVFGFRDDDGDCQYPHLNVCDLCAHALRHHWQRALGEKVADGIPKVSRSYVLVPKIRKGREELDVSSYDFFVEPDGRLPRLAYSKSLSDLSNSLASRDLVTWPETLRKCYVGYDGEGEFADVHVAWAWGQVPGGLGSQTLGSQTLGSQTLGSQTISSVHNSKNWKSFEALLSEVTPRAGFLLGVKVAFEAILWRREVLPEENHVCVVMREPAMRFLRYHLAEDPESFGEDEAMMELCRDAMSPDEQEVLALVEGAREKRREQAPAKLALPGEEKRGESEGNEDGAGDDDGGSVASGFARSHGLRGEEG